MQDSSSYSNAGLFLLVTCLFAPAVQSKGIYNEHLITVTSGVHRWTADAARRNLEYFDDDLMASIFTDDIIFGNGVEYDDDFFNSLLDFDDDDGIFETIDSIEPEFNENIIGDTNFMQCSADTDVLIHANPRLEQAYMDFINSEIALQGFDPNTMLVNIDIYYPEDTKEVLRQACAEAGGYFDVNVGSLACTYLMMVTTVSGFVGCFADTEECRAKGNYEHLEYALESQGYNTCSAPARPSLPQPVPTSTGPLTPSPVSLPTSSPTPSPVQSLSTRPSTTPTCIESGAPSEHDESGSEAVICQCPDECVQTMVFQYTGNPCPENGGCTDDGENPRVAQYVIGEAYGNDIFASGVVEEGDRVTVTVPTCFPRLVSVLISDLESVTTQHSLINSACGSGTVFDTDEYGAFEPYGCPIGY